MIWLALIFGLAALGLTWYRVSWGALLVLALLPAYQLRFTLLGQPSTVLEVVILATAAGAAVHWFQRRSPRLRISSTLGWAAGLWLVIGLAAVWVAPDHYHALGLFRAYVFEPLLLLPVWLVVAQDERARRLFVTGASAQVIVAFGVALAQRFGLIAALAPWASEQPMRVTSFFAYPNAAALYVAPLTAFIFGAWLGFRQQLARRESALWIISTFGGVAVCVLAVSRGALAALAIAFVIAGAWNKRRSVWWGVCAVLLVVFFLIPSTRHQFSRIVSTEDTSTDVRTVLWRGTWRLLQDRPLLGAGLGAFPTVYNQYRLPQHMELLQYPHNLFLNAWTELGLAGLLFTLGAIFWLSVRLFRLARSRHPWAAAGILAWLVLVVHGLVDVPYFKNDLAVLTLALFLLATAVPPADNKIPPA